MLVFVFVGIFACAGKGLFSVPDLLKHGALSVPEGHVKIYWNINKAGRVVVEWAESGGPIVVPPQRKGFGSRLLEQGIARELDGAAQAKFREEGFYWRMEFGVDESI